MIKKEINQAVAWNLDGDVPFLEFAPLRQFSFLRHGFSTRLGGVSKGCYASMNLGPNRGDDEENVRENYRRICKAMDIPWESLVFSAQTHKNFVRKVTAEDRGKGLSVPTDYTDVDAHMTDECGVPLVIFGADCVPIFFVDPLRRAIALAHAGWRGTVSNVAANTVRAMEEAYGCRPEDLVTVIGPSICQECFEVGSEVAEAFLCRYPEEAGRIVHPGNGEKSYVDLWEANRCNLLRAGVAKEHITVSGLCTMCRQDWFFSHRGSGGKRGSLVGFLMLKET